MLDNDIVFNPKFGFTAMFVGGADADLFINGIIFNFKCTKNKGYKWISPACILLHIERYGRKGWWFWYL